MSEFYKELIDKTMENIKREGWSAFCIGAGEDSPPFTYTVGLSLMYDHPDLIIFGLDANTSHNLLANAIDIIKEGNSIETNIDIHDIAGGGYPCRFLPVSLEKANEYMFQTKNIHKMLQEKQYSAMQLVWPDSDGNFSWENGAELEIIPMQPIIGEYKF